MKAPHLPTRALSKRGRRILGITGAAVLCLALAPAASQAIASEPPGVKAQGSGGGEELPNFDARRDGPARKVLAARSAQLAARPSAGVRALRQQLGMQGIVDVDPLTATPRRLSRLDGFLTGPSTRKPEAIARDYVRAHGDVFGLSAAEVAGLQLRKDYVDIAGTHHLSFVQSVGGVTVFGNGLKAHVARNGRLIQVDGSPVASLPASLGTPGFSPTRARDSAVEDVFGKSTASAVRTSTSANRKTEFSNGDQTQLVAFQTLSGTQLAWQTILMREGYLVVQDAKDGKTLFRQDLVSHDSGEAWDNYPQAPRGGAQMTRNFTSPGWLPNNSPHLAGNVAHVFKDINDDDVANPGEEVPPSGTRQFFYPFTPFSGPACLPDFVCSWDPEVPFSWQTNANQDAVQMFYFLGKFHDHLRKAPIGFTRAAGNFEAVDGDAVQGNAIDGADTDPTTDGLPDGQHVDNANMLTPPDGIPPRMQMFLFHQPHTAFPNEDPFIAGNSGDEADIVYHEYTHGLSNRLVVDANGISTLGNIQAGSMGEAWSDWYAMDLLVGEGSFRDTPTEGELRVGEYVGWGNDLIRTNPVDCSVGSTADACGGTGAGLSGPGGYTYGDFGRIIGAPEVHADGEIWVQTLWDLRKALGVNLTRSLVTRAMELSPANPSFLDMRNSILQADLVVNGGKRQNKIWQVFSHRGMGWFAAALDGDDAQPVEDFSMPPPANTPTGSLTGLVRDSLSNAPIVGATVAFGGHNSGFAGSYAAITDATGRYTITGIFPGTYPKVFSRAPGFDPVSGTLSIASRVNTLNWSLRRDWAAISGGAEIVDFNGVDFSAFGCGPAAIFDQSQGTGWSTDSVLTMVGVDESKVEERFVIVELPVAVDISDLQINPSGTCGDGASASTGDFILRTSTDGVTFNVAAQGHFGVANRNRMNSITLNAGTGTDVRFIRYEMRGTQLIESAIANGVTNPQQACSNPIPPVGFSACAFVDSVELAVYGTP